MFTVYRAVKCSNVKAAVYYTRAEVTFASNLSKRQKVVCLRDLAHLLQKHTLSHHIPTKSHGTTLR